MGYPLDGLEIVEWGDGKIAAYASKLLSDYGAHVTLLVESQSGRQTSLYGDEPSCANLALESFLDGAKQGVDVDLEDGPGHLMGLLGSADVLLLQQYIPRLDALGLSPEWISQQFPNLVLVAATLAGLTPLGRSLRHSDLVASAISGIAATTGRQSARQPSEPPLKIGGYQADYTTGIVAATAALTGLQHRRRRAGRGLLYDVSAQAVMASLMRHGISFVTYNAPSPYNSAVSGNSSVSGGFVQCKDGFFDLLPAEQYQWDGLKQMMGNPIWAREPRFASVGDRIANWAYFEPKFLEWAREYTKYDIFALGQKHRVPIFPLNDVGDFQNDSHEIYRNFLRDVAVGPDAIVVKMPGVIARVQESKSSNDSERTWVAGEAQLNGSGGMTPLPLDGIRVADFSWVLAGPYCTAHLAALGAEVIRIESSVHPDMSRRNGAFADGVRGPERSGYNHSYSIGKKSVTLDLSQPDAQELALEIVKRSDIVVENFAYGVLDHFNLGYERLRELNPNIIFVTCTGLGRSGPYRRFVAYGPPLQAFAGISSVTGQEGGGPERGLGAIWADHLGGVTSLFGLMVALEAHERSGLGQVVEVSMAEAVAAQLPESFAEYGCAGVAPGPRGNRDLYSVPHGIYRARGDDTWVALAVLTDEDWLTFREVVPGPSWWLSDELDSLAGRRVRESEINHIVSEWAISSDAVDSARLLQDRGLSAGAVKSVSDLLADPILQEREFFGVYDHPEVGRRQVTGFGWRFPGSTVNPSPPPLLGEHNWEVFVEWLGMSPERFAVLAGAGIIQ